MTDAFHAVFGPVRAAGRPEVWWRAPGVPPGAMADFLDDALAAGHTAVSLEMFDDGSWAAEGAGGHVPTLAGGEESTGADWLLTWAPQTHALPDVRPAGWTWRLDRPTATPARRA